MRKVLFILFLILSYTLQAQNYYVSEDGSDQTGTGTISNPWATLSHACGRVTTAGHVINILTDIIDNNGRAVLRPGVSIIGSGNVQITTNYPATSKDDGYVYAYSSSTYNGVQSTIAYIHFKGQMSGTTYLAHRAIWIGYRGNIKIHHCTFEDFYDCGVHFRNEVGWTTPPTVYAIGNEIHDCNFIDCSAMHGNQPAQLRLDGQSGTLIYNNVFDQRQRPLGQNGANVRWTNVQKVKMHHNTFYKNDNEVVADGTYDWNFFGELWHNFGNTEIYSNTFYGHGTLDLAGFNNDIIAGNTYSYKIYDNRFLNNVRNDPVLLRTTPYLDYSHQYAITVEGTDYEYLYIYNNYFQRYGYGIEIATGHSTATGIPARNFLHDHFYIYNNIFEDMGYATYPYSAAIMVINEVNDPGYTNTSTNWYIVNNVMTGGNRCQRGFKTTWIGTVTNINFKNNIVYDFTNYAVYHDHRTGDVTNLTNSSFTYNDFYSNGSSSIYDAVYIHGSISQTNVNRTTGNITTNPLFTDISASKFWLQASSPAIGAGTYIDTWLSTDYLGNNWMSPPSMGVYERVGESNPVVTTTPITSITSTSAISGGMVISDGGHVVTAKGVCWSINPAPTTSNSFTADGEGTGLFTSTITGLTTATTYYVRAYAVNSLGTAYGEERVFTTQPGGGVVIGDLSKQDGEFVKHLDELIYIE